MVTNPCNKDSAVTFEIVDDPKGLAASNVIQLEIFSR